VGLSDQFPIGVLLAGVAPSDLHRGAALAERLGFDEVWVSEDYFENAAFTSAAIALGATQRIRVGIGVASLLTRHPAVTAMEIATLAQAYPGRLMPGLGLGLPMSLDKLGLRPQAPVAAARTSFLAVRALLRGEQISVSGESFVADGVSLAHAPNDPPPLFMGALGPRMLELTGELADGVVTSVLASVEYLRDAKARVAEGAARATRRTPNIAAFAWYCVDNDGSRAKATLRSVIAATLGALGPLPLTDAYGISDELSDMIRRSGAMAVEREMPDRWVHDLAIAGEPQECADAIHRYAAIGVETLVLCPIPGSRMVEMLDMTATKVFPRLDGRDDAGA